MVISVTWFSSHHIVTHISHSPFALAPFFAFSLICLSYINKSFVIKISYLLPRAKLLRVNFLMKGGYLLPRGKIKLPHFPNQAHYHPRICTQRRFSHINSIHKKSSDFIQGNFAYLAFICAVWSSRGRAGEKVTAVTFFRCPTVSVTCCMVLQPGGCQSSSCYVNKVISWFKVCALKFDP